MLVTSFRHHPPTAENSAAKPTVDEVPTNRTPGPAASTPRTNATGAVIATGNPTHKTSLSPQPVGRGLPVELCQKIFRELPTHSAYDTFVNLGSVQLTAKFMKANVDGERSLNAHHLLLRKLIPSFNRLDIEFLKHGDMLGLLKPATRQAVLDDVLSDFDVYGDTSVIAQIANGLGHVNDAGRQKLLDRVLNTHDAATKAEGIGALGQGVQHFNPQQRDDLVNAALALGGDDRAEAVKGMAAGLAHLSDSQRASLLGATLAEADEFFQVQTMNALGSALTSLNKQERKDLVSAALAMGDDFDKARATTRMYAGLDFLEQEQQEALVSTGLRLVRKPLADLDPEIEAHQALVINGMGQGLKHLTDFQKNDLIDAIPRMTKTSNQALAIAGLGAGLEHMRPEQHEALITTTLSFSEEDKATAITGLAEGLEHLTVAQQNVLIDCATHIKSEYLRAGTISGLGAAMAHLQPDQQQILIEAALALNHEADKAQAISGLVNGFHLSKVSH